MSDFDSRVRGKLGRPGPFLAEVTNLLDPTYMGRMEVALLKGIPNSAVEQGETYIVNYMSPFLGNTSKRFEGNNSSDFNDVQKTYGFWMVPPDVGTRVIVIFIDGDANQGYLLGCVPHEFMNHMIPGIAATKQTNLTPEQRQKYQTDFLPTGEYLTKTQKLTDSNVNKIGKPVHPFADRLLAQGLLLDTVRGVSTSGARREVPSSVFGISTPGPLDKSPGAKKGKIGYQGDRQFYVSRLGGSTFVMDDGDVNGQNELIRIRTRTGHQILLHNSQDLIYIANSKGSAWVELTSNGKIDIFADDSVSIHTKNDFNFRADRDINLEAGRNVHIRAIGNMETNVSGFYNLIVDDYAKIAIKNDKHETIGNDYKLTVINDANIISGKNLIINSTGNVEIAASGSIKQGAAGSYNVIAGGDYRETAAKIHMNGPAAEAPGTAEVAETPPQLSTYKLPNREAAASWANGNFYKATPITSIMQRVPTHEPWDQHENINPAQFSKAATDATLQSRSGSGIADNPNTGIQEPANVPEIEPGVCDVKFAKEINDKVSQDGINALKDACKQLGITTPTAIASVLGIAGGESRWKIVNENFNYQAARLLQVFPSVFKGDLELANKYAGNPNNSLPEFLYGSNTSKGKGLGNTQPGDGAKFIGRGYIQITGRSNYARYGKLLADKGLLPSSNSLVDNPELLQDKKIAALVSVIYFVDRVKVPQTDSGYFEAACRAVGNNTPDIKATKSGFYQCFLGQLSGKIVQTGTGTLLVDSDGNPVKSGVK
jgi:putative chitinase